MNPYAFTNLLHPTVAVDYRILESNPRAVGPENTLSRAIFQAVCLVEDLLRRR